MKEQVETINHLAEVIYNETRNRDTVSRTQARVLQSIIDEMQDALDSIMNELSRPEE
jgi:hypothetical protein